MLRVNTYVHTHVCIHVYIYACMYVYIYSFHPTYTIYPCFIGWLYATHCTGVPIHKILPIAYLTHVLPLIVCLYAPYLATYRLDYMFKAYLCIPI